MCVCVCVCVLARACVCRTLYAPFPPAQTTVLSCGRMAMRRQPIDLHRHPAVLLHLTFCRLETPDGASPAESTRSLWSSGDAAPVCGLRPTNKIEQLAWAGTKKKKTKKKKAKTKKERRKKKNTKKKKKTTKKKTNKMKKMMMMKEMMMMMMMMKKKKKTKNFNLLLKVNSYSLIKLHHTIHGN